MKYELETIPVWDAYIEETECPLCLLHAKAERHYLDFFLGNSVMVPEMRIQVNEAGFCPEHFMLLLQGDNRLGLALMTETHMHELESKLSTALRALLQSAKQDRPRSKTVKAGLRKLASLLSQHRHRCLICDRLTSTLKRYAFTILHLWQREAEFRDKFLDSKGFCLHHLSFMNAMAEEMLRGKRLAEWLRDLLPLQAGQLTRLRQELSRFAQKFDHHSGGTPWETARDALPRALQKLTGKLAKPQ